ncbi:hypothetical protein Tco_0296761 [Tanacetum coccineum]
MGAKDCCLMGLRKKRCGASCNEDIRSRGGRIARWKVFRGVWVSRLENVQQGGDVASFETKRRFKQVGELLQGWACAFHQDKASSVKVPVVNVTMSSSTHLLRENTDSVRSNQWMRSTAPSVPLKYEGSVFLLEWSEFAMAVACAFKAEEMPSLISCQMASKVMTGVSDVDVLLGGILSTKDDT